MTDAANGYLRNCLIKSRGETLFSEVGGGTIIASLDGYAIIPIEDYKTTTGTPIVTLIEHTWPCPKCGEMPTADGHDPCIKNLPGVAHACCGHGMCAGYAMFDDGRVIRGDFEQSV